MSGIIITVGDPAGSGADVLLKAAAAALPVAIVAIGDRDMLAMRARALQNIMGVEVAVVDYDERLHGVRQTGVLPVIHRPCPAQVVIGEPHPDNSAHTIECIDEAVDMCIAGRFDALTTGPVNKAVIRQAGINFLGHTEWIAHRCHAPLAVMMLANDAMRVCLLTTHIPLAEVAQQVTADRLTQVISIINNDLRRLFQVKRPTIGVCGLNPHAGEGGYLGNEENTVIAPTIEALRARGLDVVGPLPADTAFTPAKLASLDVVLAMYHDQGLPVIKHADFGGTVNITLGLPIVRTSVDHGTAADLAGTFQADESSLRAAIVQAHQLSAHKTVPDRFVAR